MITLNTSISNTNYRYQRNSNPSFNGAMPTKSAFLNPFKKGFDKLTDGIAKYYYGPLVSSKITHWLSHRNDIGRIVDHMQAIGSYVISGMYMLQTIRNKDMDEDRRRTLAINQGLTLVASTAIAYLVSERLVGPWNKHVSMKYAANKRGISVEQLEKDLKAHQEKIKKIYTEKHPEDLELKKFKKPNLIHYVEKGLKNEKLAGKLKGLDVLKSLIIFGSVYRFFGPVAVTPVATWLGNLLTGANKKANAQKQNANPEVQTAQEVKNNNDLKDFKLLQRPEMAKFLGKTEVA